MERKNNRSTDLRPEGARVIDAPMVSIGIPEFIKQLKEEITWQASDRNAITIHLLRRWKYNILFRIVGFYLSHTWDLLK